MNANFYWVTIRSSYCLQIKGTSCLPFFSLRI
jgi:hypothetical protein